MLSFLNSFAVAYSSGVGGAIVLCSIEVFVLDLVSEPMFKFPISNKVGSPGFLNGGLNILLKGAESID